MKEYNEQVVETLDDAGCIIANKNIIIDNFQARIAELEAENERLRDAVRQQESQVLREQATSLDIYQQLAKAEQRVAEAERDASRYRFLRDTCEMTRSFRMKGEFKNEDGDLTEYEWNSGPSAIYFDKAIDAEMARFNGASS